jgi:hypothetical protein
MISERRGHPEVPLPAVHLAATPTRKGHGVPGVTGGENVLRAGFLEHSLEFSHHSQGFGLDRKQHRNFIQGKPDG